MPLLLRPKYATLTSPDAEQIIRGLRPSFLSPRLNREESNLTWQVEHKTLAWLQRGKLFLPEPLIVAALRLGSVDEIKLDKYMWHPYLSQKAPVEVSRFAPSFLQYVLDPDVMGRQVTVSCLNEVAEISVILRAVYPDCRICIACQKRDICGRIAEKLFKTIDPGQVGFFPAGDRQLRAIEVGTYEMISRLSEFDFPIRLFVDVDAATRFQFRFQPDFRFISIGFRTRPPNYSLKTELEIESVFGPISPVWTREGYRSLRLVWFSAMISQPYLHGHDFKVTNIWRCPLRNDAIKRAAEIAQANLYHRDLSANQWQFDQNSVLRSSRILVVTESVTHAHELARKLSGFSMVDLIRPNVETPSCLLFRTKLIITIESLSKLAWPCDVFINASGEVSTTHLRYFQRTRTMRIEYPLIIFDFVDIDDSNAPMPSIQRRDRYGRLGTEELILTTTNGGNAHV